MKAHRTDGVSLTFALIFLAIAAWWLVAQILDLAVPAAGWFVAGVLILLGFLGLLGALRAGRAAPPPDQAAGATGGTGPTSGIGATGGTGATDDTGATRGAASDAATEPDPTRRPAV